MENESGTPSLPSPSPRYRASLLLRDELANEAALVLILDASKYFGAKSLDSLGAIERQALMHRAAVEVAGLTLGFEDGFDLGAEIDSGGSRCGWSPCLAGFYQWQLGGVSIELRTKAQVTS